MKIPFEEPVRTLAEKFAFPVRYPEVAVEIDARCVTVVRLKRDRRGGRLAGWGLSAIPAWAAPPTATSLHHHKPQGGDELRRAIEQAGERAGAKGGKASLILPDSLARVWVLQLPELPRGNAAMLDMIRWKVKRTLPFKVDDGAIVWQVITRPAGAEGATVLAALIPRVIVEHYEEVLAGAGFKTGLFDLASFNLYNAYRGEIARSAAASADFGIVNAAETYFTLLLFRRGELTFFRCKIHAEGEGADAEERVRTFRRELATSQSYYAEKLGGKGLQRTYLRVNDPALEIAAEVMGALEFGEIEMIDPGRIASLPRDLEQSIAMRLVPAIGAAMGRGA